ncbi:ABC transporter ATP-binding protein [Oceanirhabdus seepicola]|uniref:ABC transporter ATP-binding protein n=1 Tax=Oceanirhabdus seepicola TaxID=2828781 RepID=A0A9J6P5P6_9CLOT|nr:ABC transporter ATP-binding protein [Oceanirhabdus seepicola]MCM1991149.1 ABC transporter ATP-binding protein [Oceanirhabdus seepicola]
MKDKKVETNGRKLTLDLIKYKPGLFIITTILWIIKDILPLVNGMVIKEVFDVIEGTSSFNVGISGLLMMIATIALIEIIIFQVAFRTNISFEYSTISLIRRNIFNSILKKPGGKALNCLSGHAINSIRDDANQVKSLLGWISWLVGQIIRAIAAIIILSTIDIKVTFLVFLPLVAIVLFAQKFEKKVEKNREKSREASANVTSAIGEIFESALSIKVSAAEDDVINRLEKLNNKRSRLSVKDSILTTLIDSIYNNAVTIGTGLILLLVGRLIMNGSFSIGDFAIFVYYLSYVTDTIESLGNFIVFARQTEVSFKRMSELACCQEGNELTKHKEIYLNEKNAYKHEEVNDRENLKVSDLRTLEIKRLNHCYENSSNGIKDIDFTIKKGEVTVICGRTGAGKSTLIKNIIGLIPSDSGELYWNGEKIEKPSEFFIPPICSYTPQIPNLFSETVRENILFGIEDNEETMNQAIYSSVLESDITKLDEGLDTVIGSKGVKLSGGQKQRVAAARMFARRGELLVLDDISSALDVNTEKLLWERLFAEKKQTCLIVSNKKIAIEHADNIILMKDGAIEDQGKLEELLSRNKELWQIIA